MAQTDATDQTARVVEKLRALTPAHLAQVEDFIDFLTVCEQSSLRARMSKVDSGGRPTPGFPVDSVEDWPEDFSLARKDLYSDEGR